MMYAAIQNTKDWVKYYALSVKQGKLQPMSLIERRVRAATSNDTQEPIWTEEIADYCCDGADKLDEVFIILDDRLNAPNYKWRSVAKALKLVQAIVSSLEFPDAQIVLEECMEGLLELSKNFIYIDEEGLDQGEQVRRLADSTVYNLQECIQRDLLLMDIISDNSLQCKPEQARKIAIQQLEKNNYVRYVAEQLVYQVRGPLRNMGSLFVLNVPVVQQYKKMTHVIISHTTSKKYKRKFKQFQTTGRSLTDSEERIAVVQLKSIESCQLRFP
eukprot:TRINITY_DN29688_c0_g2_i2.p1 TRINITY_DN29688_c0_g2~~TRINITY_DN29688_c0_g2_i2.p1  ORF type:complete len:272 (-),score=22.87 TRINITY_DN29688_c0_g2_i2:358-1173(-)